MPRQRAQAAARERVPQANAPAVMPGGQQVVLRRIRHAIHAGRRRPHHRQTGRIRPRRDRCQRPRRHELAGGPPALQAGQRRIIQRRPRQPRQRPRSPRQPRPAHIRPEQRRPPQPRLRQIRPPQIRVRKIGTGEVGPNQQCALQIRIDKNRGFQIGILEVGSDKTSPAEVRLAQISVPQLTRRKIKPGIVTPAEILSRHVRSGQTPQHFRQSNNLGRSRRSFCETPLRGGKQALGVLSVVGSMGTRQVLDKLKCPLEA